MRRNIIVFFSICILNLLTLVSVNQSIAQGIPQAFTDKRILIIDGVQEGLPQPEAQIRGLMSTFKKQGFKLRNVHIEHLDLARYPDSMHHTDLAQLFRRKFARGRIDLIIVINQQAFEFVASNLEDLLPKVPLLLENIQIPPIYWDYNKRKIINLYFQPDIAGTLNYAIKIFPDTRQLVVITGRGDLNVPFLAATAKAIAGLEKKLKVEYTGKLSYEEMLQRITTLPQHTVALLEPYFNDRTGRNFIPAEVAKAVSKVANVPVFSDVDILISQGLFGGSAVISEQVGKRGGQIALDYLNGKIILNEPITRFKINNIPFFNWSQLKRWNVDVGDLPANSIFINRPLTLWGQYKEIAISALLVIATLIVLVLALIIQGLRRKKAVGALRESEESFRNLFEDHSVIKLIIDPATGNIIRANIAAAAYYDWSREELAQMRFQEIALMPQAEVKKNLEAASTAEKDHFECQHRRSDGSIRDVEVFASNVEMEGERYLHYIIHDITERKQAEDSLRRIQWMLSPDAVQDVFEESYAPSYGDLVQLNQSRAILDSVGGEALVNIAMEYLSMLGTSAAVYESNGDYALGIFSSGWCRFMDQASRNLCGTVDNQEALDSGKWLCHESCWTQASKRALETGEPVDIACAGGLRLYALPVLAGGKLVGSINFGYGDPPTDPETLRGLADLYRVDQDELNALAHSYESRPPFIVELAKHRLASAASLIGLIVERKKAEEALRESEERFRQIIENTQAGYFFIDNQGHFQRVNQAWLDLHGYQKAEEVVGRHFSLTQAERDLEHAQATVKQLLGGQDILAGEFARRRKDGSVGYHNFSARPVRKDGIIVGLEGFLIDTTQLRQAQKDYETLFTEMLDAFALHEIICDQSGKPIDYRFLAANPAFERMTGLKVDDLLGKTVLEVLPGTEGHWIETYGKVALTGEPAFFENYAQDLQQYFEVTAFRPAPLQFACIFKDITWRKRAEEEIRNSEEKFRSFSEQSLVGIYLIKDGAFVYVNPKFAEIFGYAVQECLDNMHFSQLVHPDDLAAVNEQLRRGAEREIDTVHYEFRGIKKDGQILYGEVHGSAINYEGGVALMGTMLDITDRKKAEEERTYLEAQLAKAQKMDALGTLASGIAHDFNNLLAAIMGYSELIQDELLDDSTCREDMAEITKAAASAKTLVRRILTFSRESQHIKKAISIDEVLRDASSILSRTIPKMISLEFDIDQDLLPIKADPLQMEQILLNLAANAADAIGGQGSITIAAENVIVDNRRCDVCANAFSGEYVLLSVKDTGSGMNPETKVRIFDPFFTTKEVGRGTGLGLSTVYGIVTSHQGHISCLSEEGKGTEFQIYLPVAKDEIVQTDLNGLGRDAPLQGDETILVVDDEAVVSDIAQRILARHGYKVLQASSGEEALAVYREHLGSINGVIMDLGMPGMGGKACLPLILNLDSQAKVLIASGYIQYELTDELKKLGAAGMIAKPYRKNDLLKNVREMLNGKVAD